MIIDLIDLNIIRELENGCRAFPGLVIKKLNITKENFFSRLVRLESTGLIKDYKSSVFLPALVGGDWFLGCGFGSTPNHEKTLEHLTQALPFLLEVWQNISFPVDFGPNLSFTFYCKDPPSVDPAPIDGCGVEQFPGAFDHFSYLEFYNLRKYSFPVPLPLATDEKKLLRAINDNPTVAFNELINIVNQEPPWIEEKLNRLMSNHDHFDDRSYGVTSIMQILPELNWQVCENFCHVHFIAEYPDAKLPMSNSDLPAQAGFQIVLGGKPFRDKFYQLETDLWGFSELASKLKIIQQSGFKIKGLVLAGSNIIINSWTQSLLV